MFPRREVRAACRAGREECPDGAFQDKEKIKREELRTIGAMNQVGEWIGLKGVKRIEAYDISISAASNQSVP